MVARIAESLAHAGARTIERWRLAVFFILPGMMATLLAMLPPDAAPPPPVSKEYQVKAAFLFNFVQFLEWPSTAFTSADSPICLGILGEDPFGPALEETVRGETIQNRKLIVRRSHQLDDLKNCQLVFISKSETGRLAGLLDDLGPLPVLTVGESQGFAAQGGIINLYLNANKVRFEINAAAARRKGLKISSELLSLGKIVDPAPERERQ